MRRRDVLTYLIERGLLSRADVVLGGLAIVDCSRRHVNFAVTTRHGPRWFLKHAPTPSGYAALAREASVYRGLQRGDGRSDEIVPGYHSFDTEAGVLVLECGEERGTLREASLERRRPSIPGAAAAGRTLAGFHRATEAAAGRSWPPPSIPWILRVHRPGPRLLEELSAANVELIRIIQRHGRFGELLDGLAADLAGSALAHGDVRWDNCLLGWRTGTRSATVRLVDLELAGEGDSRWDLGCMFAEYLGAWVLSVPVAGGVLRPGVLEAASQPLEPMQPAIRAFWRAYGAEADVTVDADFLLRSVAFAGGRLIQTAFEHTHESPYVTSQAVCLLQLSLNIMERPAEAAVHLLGIAPS